MEGLMKVSIWCRLGLHEWRHWRIGSIRRGVIAWGCKACGKPHPQFRWPL
jgi:hypothetical protein